MQLDFFDVVTFEPAPNWGPNSFRCSCLEPGDRWFWSSGPEGSAGALHGKWNCPFLEALKAEDLAFNEALEQRSRRRRRSSARQAP